MGQLHSPMPAGWLKMNGKFGLISRRSMYVVSGSTMSAKSVISLRKMSKDTMKSSFFNALATISLLPTLMMALAPKLIIILGRWGSWNFCHHHSWSAETRMGLIMAQGKTLRRPKPLGAEAGEAGYGLCGDIHRSAIMSPSGHA